MPNNGDCTEHAVHAVVASATESICTSPGRRRRRRLPVLACAVLTLISPTVARGQAWLAPILTSPAGEGGVEPQLVTTPNGDAISAWVSRKAGVAGPVDTRIALGATGYGPVQALSSATPAPHGLKLATSGDGTVLAACMDTGRIDRARPPCPRFVDFCSATGLYPARRRASPNAVCRL